MSKIVLNGVTNIREFGGIENKVGREIKYKNFLRSSELSKLNPEGVEQLRTKYCVQKIIDLRNPSEILEKPNICIPDCEEVNIPLLKNSIPGFTSEKDAKLEKGKALDITSVYREMMSDFGIAQIKKVFKVILTSDKTVMWVSSNGRDRVGLISALFLKILDVSDEEIKKDYLFSNECIKPTGLKALFGKNKVDPNAARPEYLEIAYSVLVEKYGSVDKFLEKELGITKEFKLQFQKKYLVY